MAKPLIPAIVLQYGKTELTERCLSDLRAQTGVMLRIILVDAATPDLDTKTWQRLAAQADEAIKLKDNLGYAGGNNFAIKKSLQKSDKCVFIVNNDVELPPDCLTKLHSAMERHSKAAQVVPLVYYPDGLLQAAGGTIREDLFEPQLIGNRTEKKTARESKVRYAPGMAMLVRTAAIERAGLLAEDFFMYGEDVDWSLRFTREGYEIWLAPEARITHFESAGIGQFNQQKAYYLTRANVLLAKRWLDRPAWKQFVRRFHAKLWRQSLKWFSHPAYILGMWKGYRAGLRKETGR